MKLIPKTYFLKIFSKDNKATINSDSKFDKLCDSENVELLECDNTAQAIELIEKYRPLIILIEESLSVCETIYNYQTQNYNPYKIVFLKNFELEKNLEHIKKGADDVITDNASQEEVFLRCQTHLRRKTLGELNSLTHLPSINKTYQVINYCKNNIEEWVLCHIDTLNFKSYNTMYGTKNGDSVIKSIAEILKNATPKENFVGHLGRDHFIIVCSPSNFQEILEKINDDFKKMLSSFYSENDFTNKYIISTSSSKIKRRVSLLDLYIGYCFNKDYNFKSSTEIVEQAIKNKQTPRPKNKKILLCEDDQDFAYLLSETLDREGCMTKISNGFEHIISEIEKYKPGVLILEASKMSLNDFQELCKKLQVFKSDFGLKILVATNFPGYKDFLSAGADVYMSKPYDLEVLFREVRRLRFLPM